MQLFKELQRRNVVRVTIGYIVSSWLLIQVADLVLENIGSPDWVMQTIMLVLVLGFPVVVFFSWAYEVTPEGLKRESEVDRSQSITHLTGRKLDRAITAVLVVALAYFAYDKFVLSTVHEAALVEAKAKAVTEQVANKEAPTESDKSIAVLPFVNMSDDASNEFFSDGISEEILNLLAKVPELRVTSRSSAFSFKGQNLDVPTMAARLKVAHVLEGSVRKAGNQLRITAQLIDVVTDTHLWSETYDRELANIFAIQDEIAAAVVAALKITLLGKEPQTTQTNPEAYALYLQGRHFNNQFTAESNKQAETLLKQALEIDPGFAPAWAELGAVYNTQAAMAFRRVDEAIELARDAIQKTLAIDPQYGRAYAALASIEMYYDRDFTAAFQHQQQALALNPGDAFILVNAANIIADLGHIDEAIGLYWHSIALDPVSPAGHHQLGYVLYAAHRLDEAADSIQFAMSLSPGRIQLQYLLGRVLLAQGDAVAALVAMEKESYDGFRLTGTAVVQHALGDAKASDAALQELIENWAVEAAYQIADVYAFRGEIDHAFEWLDRAYDNRDTGLPGMLLDPLLANLHDDPRWLPILDKVGLLAIWREMEER